MSSTPGLTQTLLSEEAAELRNEMQLVQLSDGQILFRKDEPGDAFYIIESGNVRIFTLDEEGKEITLNTLHAGEAFGELALMDDRPRSASASAIGPTILRRLSRDDFLQRVNTSPTLSEVVIRLLSERARHMTDYIERLGQWSRLVANGKYDQAMKNIEETGEMPDRALLAVANAVQEMVRAVKEREEKLRQEVQELRIQIDDSKRQQQVEEITTTDYFQNLAQQARKLRKRD